MGGYGTQAAQTEATAKMRYAKRMMEREKCKHPALRKRLEKDSAAWLKHYLSKAYPLPFGQVHLDIIKGAESALATGGKFCVAAPRGSGKSTELWGLAFKFVLTGKLSFPALLPWKSTDLRKALRFWKNALCFNKTIAEDYPEYAQPFARSRGSSQKCLSLTWRSTDKSGNETSEPTGAELRLSDGMIIFPDGKGAIGSSTINGNPRGLNHATERGAVLRPDLVFIDDPQDKDVAKSSAQTVAICDVIDTDVMGMAGPDKRMPALMACTVSRVGDVASHYLSAPDWTALKVGQIVTWPKHKEEWEKIGAMIREQDEPAALKYYRDNKVKLLEGMTVSWEHRFDKKRKEPDAYYSAMRDFYFMGKSAFMAERQNEPIEEGAGDMPYRLSAEIIQSRCAEREAYLVPDWVDMILVSTDLNPSYAFTSTCVGFGRDQSAAVMWYGLFTSPPLPIKNEMPEPEQDKKLFEALVIHGKQLAGLSCAPKVWAVDAGYNFDTVTLFAPQAARLCGLPAMAFWGSGWKNYRHFSKTLKPGPQREMLGVHGDRGPNGNRREWVVWHSDYWREIAQKAWLGSVGAPGACSLFRGHHGEFAQQVSSEILAKKGIGLSGKLEWIWKTRPGAHDYGDCMAQAYAAAAWGGVGTGGQIKYKKYIETRKCKVPLEE